MINKLWLVLGTMVASAWAGVGGYYLFHQPSSKEKTIDQWLDVATRGKKITKSNKGVAAAVQKWKNYIAESTNIFGVSDWSTSKNTQETVPNTFVDACDTQLTIKVENKLDQKYKNYITYCTTA
ncbi:hypothetical protein A6V39_03835 [Candidatus Mycoplasma haematobovis]|uniref:Uncharacterized protein n=1 Tax=Candidatus Mycoplasma haematobovis TaxID=432608 RepID=A0A1A9QCQ8_9MOLU|nr:hypothetical protein [Candidatus Mycoplasma haematobovis]OAL10018.1 hypothetical protein A6V39_03835 [Candidatus Mycoplasma haematobovis]